MENKEISLEEINFRKATEKDIIVLLDLINGIAIYENMVDKVVATEESLKESIFENNRAEALLIENSNRVLGYLYISLIILHLLEEKGYILRIYTLRKNIEVRE